MVIASKAFTFEFCDQEKGKKASFPTKLVPSTESKLELIHMDLCGPMRVESINGKKYILVTVDDYSRYTWVYFLHTKDEAPDMIINFINQVQRNLKAQILKIQTDNGTEFKNEKLRSFYAKLGIVHHTSIARTPQQNGVVERRNFYVRKETKNLLRASEWLGGLCIASLGVNDVTSKVSNHLRDSDRPMAVGRGDGDESGERQGGRSKCRRSTRAAERDDARAEGRPEARPRRSEPREGASTEESLRPTIRREEQRDPRARARVRPVERGEEQRGRARAASEDAQTSARERSGGWRKPRSRSRGERVRSGNGDGGRRERRQGRTRRRPCQQGARGERRDTGRTERSKAGGGDGGEERENEIGEQETDGGGGEGAEKRRRAGGGGRNGGAGARARRLQRDGLRGEPTEGEGRCATAEGRGGTGAEKRGGRTQTTAREARKERARGRRREVTSAGRAEEHRSGGQEANKRRAAGAGRRRGARERREVGQRTRRARVREPEEEKNERRMSSESVEGGADGAARRGRRLRRRQTPPEEESGAGEDWAQKVRKTARGEDCTVGAASGPGARGSRARERGKPEGGSPGGVGEDDLGRGRKGQGKRRRSPHSSETARKQSREGAAREREGSEGQASVAEGSTTEAGQEKEREWKKENVRAESGTKAERRRGETRRRSKRAAAKAQHRLRDRRVRERAGDGAAKAPRERGASTDGTGGNGARGGAQAKVSGAVRSTQTGGREGSRGGSKGNGQQPKSGRGSIDARSGAGHRAAASEGGSEGASPQTKERDAETTKLQGTRDRRRALWSEARQGRQDSRRQSRERTGENTGRGEATKPVEGADKSRRPTGAGAARGGAREPGGEQGQSRRAVKGAGRSCRALGAGGVGKGGETGARQAEHQAQTACRAGDQARIAAGGRADAESAAPCEKQGRVSETGARARAAAGGVPGPEIGDTPGLGRPMPAHRNGRLGRPTLLRVVRGGPWAGGPAAYGQRSRRRWTRSGRVDGHRRPEELLLSPSLSKQDPKGKLIMTELQRITLHSNGPAKINKVSRKDNGQLKILNISIYARTRENTMKAIMQYYDICKGKQKDYGITYKHNGGKQRYMDSATVATESILKKERKHNGANNYLLRESPYQQRSTQKDKPTVALFIYVNQSSFAATRSSMH
ncbi:putative ribonuclease H-like domain-containing protein [Tanacetum coccineum]